MHAPSFPAWDLAQPPRNPGSCVHSKFIWPGSLQGQCLDSGLAALAAQLLWSPSFLPGPLQLTHLRSREAKSVEVPESEAGPGTGGAPEVGAGGVAEGVAGEAV